MLLPILYANPSYTERKRREIKVFTFLVLWTFCLTQLISWFTIHVSVIIPQKGNWAFIKLMTLVETCT